MLLKLKCVKEVLRNVILFYSINLSLALPFATFNRTGVLDVLMYHTIYNGIINKSYNCVRGLSVLF